jgi:hypothetical protein
MIISFHRRFCSTSSSSSASSSLLLTPSHHLVYAFYIDPCDSYTTHTRLTHTHTFHTHLTGTPAHTLPHHKPQQLGSHQRAKRKLAIIQNIITTKAKADADAKQAAATKKAAAKK